MGNRARLTSLLTTVLLLLSIQITCFGLVSCDSKDNSKDLKMSTDTKRSDSDTGKENIGIFIPTDEWQVVRKGQPIPKGLHVRINFETGKTEAKKLDVDESKSTAVTVVKHEDVEDEPDKTRDKLKSSVGDALRNIKSDDHRHGDTPKEPVEVSPKKFKTYDELKQHIADLDLLTTSDMEMLVQLIDKFPATSGDERLSVLTDIEYLVHQIDNAMEFARLEGIKKVVYPSFNDTDVAVRSAAVRLLGSAVQSNPQVQMSAVSTGSVQLLLRTLLLDKEITVRSSALYALSCLIRHFPSAQTKMVSEGGLMVLAQTFDQKDNGRLQIKVVTLLSDLVEENRSTNTTAQLETKLVESGWCERVPTLLVSEISKPDNDVVEKVTNAMLALVNVCQVQFGRMSVRTTLLRLEGWYKEVVQSDPDEYFIGLAHLLRNLITQLTPINVEL